jgi:hypothetical protein
VHPGFALPNDCGGLSNDVALVRLAMPILIKPISLHSTHLASTVDFASALGTTTGKVYGWGSLDPYALSGLNAGTLEPSDSSVCPVGQTVEDWCKCESQPLEYQNAANTFTGCDPKSADHNNGSLWCFVSGHDCPVAKFYSKAYSWRNCSLIKGQ